MTCTNRSLINSVLAAHEILILSDATTDANKESFKTLVDHLVAYMDKLEKIGKDQVIRLDHTLKLLNTLRDLKP